MAKPYSRLKGKICDFRFAGDDAFVRAEFIDLVKELNEWVYLIRYTDNDKKSMVSGTAIIEVIEVRDLKPTLKLVTRIGGKNAKRRTKV